MFTVEFYQYFSKKPNSTRRPTADESYAARKYDCILKEPSSIINPVISLDLRLYEDEEYMTTITPSRWNYAYIDRFQRYYFIEDIESDHGLFTFYLKCDVLASFKDEIEDETAYVFRSQKMRDQFISDAFYPAKIDMNENMLDFDEYDGSIVQNDIDGSYIVGIINSSNSTTAVSYYALEYSEFNALKYSLFNVDNYRPSGSMIEISDELLKILYNPFQYISSVLYVPFRPSDLTEQASQQIHFGWWPGNVGVQATGKPLYHTTSDLLYCGYITFNRHPDAGQQDNMNEDGIGIEPFYGMGQYLNYAPYSQYFVRFEPFGFFELDNQIMGDLLSKYTEGSIELDFYVKLDVITGRAYLHIKPRLDTEFEFAVYFTPIEAQLGTPLQIGQITADTMGGTFTVAQKAAESVSRIAGEASRLRIGSAAARAVEAVVDVAASIYDGHKQAAPKLVTSGSNGSFAAFDELRYGYYRFSSMCENDPSETGHPLMRKVKLEDCKPGFVLCGFTDIKIPGATENERSEIVQLMTSGFHLED